jgi:hypothetical protein
MDKTIDKLKDCVNGLSRFDKNITGVRRQKVFVSLVEETKLT